MRNIFQRLLSRPQPPDHMRDEGLVHPSLERLRRDSSLIQAEFLGLQSHAGEFGPVPGIFALSRQQKRELRDLVERAADPCILIDPRPGLRIVDYNDAFAKATFINRGAIEGEQLFRALPGNVNDDSVAIAFEAYKICAQRRRPHTLPLQRYDIESTCDDTAKRHWHSTYLPITDDADRLIYIINRPIPLAA